jgi:hypothetical protein
MKLFSFFFKWILVIVERYPAPLPKPPTIIYEKYLQPTQQPRQVIVKREICRPALCSVVQPQSPGRHLVRQIIRQIPQTSQSALVCVPQQQTTTQQQVFQQFVPVFATRQVSFQRKKKRAHLDNFLLLKKKTNELNLSFISTIE